MFKIEILSSQIEQINQVIDKIILYEPQVIRLTQIPGIGIYSALLIVYEIGDIKRFPKATHFCSYIGIVPSVRQSGTINYTGRITKEGNKYLRWILAEAAQNAALLPTNPFHKHYQNKKVQQKQKLQQQEKLL